MERKNRILVIDDTAIAIRSLNNMLKDFYEILIAKSGLQGIESAKKYKPDLILLDLVMPEMSGFDVLNVLKSDADTRDIPVILISASDSREDEEKGYTFGAIDYVKKPFVDGIIKHRIRYALEYHAMYKSINNIIGGRK